MTFQVKTVTGKMLFYPRTRPTRPSLAGISAAPSFSGLKDAIVFDADIGEVSFGPDNDSSYTVWPTCERQNIEVEYESGFSATPGDMPDELQEAVILKAAMDYARLGAFMNLGLKREGIGKATKERLSKDDYQAMQDEIERRLATFKRWEVAA